MNKKKSFFGIYLIITCVLVITAIVMSLTLGINLGSDINGGTQFEVAFDGTIAHDNDIEKIKDIVKDNGEDVETIFVEDKLVNSVIVVRIADKKIEKETKIKQAIIEKLNLEESDISAFNTFEGSITNKVVLYTGITIACLLLALFVFAWIRYQLIAGLSLVFSMLNALMLMVSLTIITRVPLTMVSIMIMLGLLAVVLFAMVLFLEKLRANSKLKQYESLQTSELVEVSQKSVLKPLLVLAALILVVAVVMVCVPVRFVALSACTVIECLAVAVFTYYCVGVPMHERLVDIKAHSDKMKLSRNSSPAPKKNNSKNK